MYGFVLNTPHPERHAAELKRRSEIRAARRAALIEKHGSVEVVIEPTQYERSIIHQLGDVLTEGREGNVVIPADKVAVVASVLINWPMTAEQKIAEAIFLEARHDDLCAMYDIDPDDRRNPMHPALIVRKAVIDRVLIEEHDWPYGFGHDPAPKWWPIGDGNGDIDDN